MKRCIICLQELDLFQGLESEQLANMCACTARKRLPKGEYLFQQGEKTRTVYLIKSGKLKLVQSTEDGQETILDVCGPGEVLVNYRYSRNRMSLPAQSPWKKPVSAASVNSSLKLW